MFNGPALDVEFHSLMCLSQASVVHVPANRLEVQVTGRTHPDLDKHILTGHSKM